jgi:hypothetical protein
MLRGEIVAKTATWAPKLARVATWAARMARMAAAGGAGMRERARQRGRGWSGGWDAGVAGPWGYTGDDKGELMFFLLVYHK